MSNIPVSDSAGNVQYLDTFTREESGTTVHTQAMTIVDPNTGTPIVGQQPASTSISVVQASVTSAIVSLEISGAFSALPSNSCTSVRLSNTHPNAVDISVRRGGSGGTECLPASSWAVYDGITNTNQLQLRRWDGVAATATLSMETRI